MSITNGRPERKDVTERIQALVKQKQEEDRKAEAARAVKAASPSR